MYWSICYISYSPTLKITSEFHWWHTFAPIEIKWKRTFLTGEHTLPKCKSQVESRIQCNRLWCNSAKKHNGRTGPKIMKTKMRCVPVNGRICYKTCSCCLSNELLVSLNIRFHTSDCILIVKFFSLVLFSFSFSIVSVALQTLHCSPLIGTYVFESLVQWQR